MCVRNGISGIKFLMAHDLAGTQTTRGNVLWVNTGNYGSGPGRAGESFLTTWELGKGDWISAEEKDGSTGERTENFRGKIGIHEAGSSLRKHISCYGKPSTGGSESAGVRGASQIALLGIIWPPQSQRLRMRKQTREGEVTYPGSQEWEQTQGTQERKHGRVRGAVSTWAGIWG